MPSTETLLAAQPSATAGPFDHYALIANRLPLEPTPDLRPNTPMLRLPAVSMATLRYVAAPVASMHPKVRGITVEASLRLAHWGWQGGRQSAWSIAKQLAAVYFPTAVDGCRRNFEPLTRIPRKGLALIAAIDKLGCEGIEWFCDAPRHSDPFSFETVRLTTALESLEGRRSTIKGMA